MNWSQEELKNATPRSCFVSKLCDGDWIEAINFTKDLNVRIVVIKLRRSPIDADKARVIFASIARCEPAEIMHKTGFREVGSNAFFTYLEMAEMHLNLKQQR